MQCHMLAVAPITIKEAVQAIKKYSAVSGLDQTRRVMPVEPNGTACPTLITGNQSEGNGGRGDTANYAIAKSTEEGGTETGQITKGLLQMRRSEHEAGLFPRRQATASHHQTSNDEKRERSGTDMSSLVTGSQVSEQTDSKISAVADTQED